MWGKHNTVSSFQMGRSPYQFGEQSGRGFVITCSTTMRQKIFTFFDLTFSRVASQGWVIISLECLPGGCKYIYNHWNKFISFDLIRFFLLPGQPREGFSKTGTEAESLSLLPEAPFQIPWTIPKNINYHARLIRDVFIWIPVLIQAVFQALRNVTLWISLWRWVLSKAV